ncbi:MAG: protein kinase [Planctomycetes bacterium]|nr:protein kinase [Planctomycetota bacterium]
MEAHDGSIEAFRKAQQCCGRARDEAAVRIAARARAGEALGLVLRHRGDDLARAGQILDELEPCRCPEAAPVLTRCRGLLAFRHGARRQARLALLQAVKQARAAGDLAREAEALDSLAGFCRFYGEAGRAEAYLFKALEIQRTLGDRGGQVLTLGKLGDLCLRLGRAPSAEHYFEEAFAGARELEDPGRMARLLCSIAKALVGQGKLGEADRKLKMGLMLARRLEGGTVEADLLTELAEVARRGGRRTEARKRLDLARRSYVRVSELAGAAVTECLRANLHFEEGDPRAACGLLEAATDVLRQCERPAELVPALGLMAQVACEVGDPKRAVSILDEAVQAARRHHFFRELEALEREKYRLEHSRPDSGGDENTLRFFREFCLHGLRGTVKEYRVVREIGAGRTGVVFEAYDASLARSVAVKRLTSELSNNNELAARFRRELEQVGLIDHPAVMTVYSCGRNDDRFFYVTDLLPGPSIKMLLATAGPLPFAQALPLMAQVAEALSAVHAAGVIHQDLKPANILLDEDRRPVVVDFGITGKHQVASARGDLDGHAHLYRPPEQLAGRTKPAREWDIFALGSVLYEVLSGRQPFPARFSREFVARARAGRIAPLRTNGKALPKPLKTLLERMLDSDPKRRPTAAEAAEQLAHHG